ncbi:squalene monooxygenase [Bradyrhizobium diazoefficiens]|nr:squalene monooxygenase [Bradyrhizobium diazoefficiens]MBR0701958.1 squalene monooxygenase [Bradyrhizobium diazoefficiens]MBR0770381.1 squalene monooxygenase [Bradyrhizobium diazoefficiens]
MSSLIGKQAVVIGAGIGGLAAAGAVAGYFEQVTVLERDTLPSWPQHRPGTPQGRHLHVLLMSGLRALDELFPGFARDLERSGAIPLTVGLDVRVERLPYDPFPQRDLGYVGYAASRAAIEHTLRSRVRELKNVMIRQQCRARELMASPEGRVIGVRFENGVGGSEMRSTDLVIDASGRSPLTAALLQATGRPLPEETSIGIDLGYSSCVFERNGNGPTDWKAVFTFPDAPADLRGGTLFPIEGDRWIATLVGRHGVAMPDNLEGLLAYARALRTSTIYDVISEAKCLTDVYRYNFPQSTLRHFHLIENFPQGLLPIGDLICQFNPTWGQGMSVASQEACLLRRQLDLLIGERDPMARLAPDFFAKARPLIEEPWSVAMLDFVFPQTRGNRPPDFAMTLKFGAALNRLAAEDAAIHKLTAEVQNLLKPRSVYGDPALVQRVRAVMHQ